MSFKEFDLSDYIEALENFKSNNTDDIVRYWGRIENLCLSKKSRMMNPR